jgi:hypothetical protein
MPARAELVKAPPVLAGDEGAVSYLKAPVISAPSVSFDDSLLVHLQVAAGAALAYRLVDSEGMATDWQKQPTVPEEGHSVLITENTTLEAYAYTDGVTSATIPATFYKVPHPNWEVQLQGQYNPQYSAGGANGIIDGILGATNWRKGYWQGYQNQDFEAVIVFNETVEVDRIAASFLQDTRSWILMPTRVTYHLSTDGKNYQQVAAVTHHVAPNDYEVQRQVLEAKLPQPMRAMHLKIKATNFGTLPKWHQGAGFEAFIFVDEVVVE